MELKRDLKLKANFIDFRTIWETIWNHSGLDFHRVSKENLGFGCQNSSILGAKTVQFGSLGGPWHREKNRPEKVPKKDQTGYRHSLILEEKLASSFDDFSVWFSVRFLDHFWSDLGVILGPHLA